MKHERKKNLLPPVDPRRCLDRSDSSRVLSVIHFICFMLMCAALGWAVAEVIGWATQL